MTKKIFTKDERSMSVIIKGDYPTHSVVGIPSDFYVYLSGNGTKSWSEWIKGNPTIYHKLSDLHKKREPQAFIDAVEDLWQKNQKS